MPINLSPQQIDQFVEEGYVVMRGLIPRPIADTAREQIFQSLEIDPQDPSTWQGKPNVCHQQIECAIPCRTPDIERIAQQLIGSDFLPEVVDSPYLEHIGKPPRMRGFIPILNYPVPGEKIFAPPTGYHIDGMHRTTVLPQKFALILFAYLTDVAEYGGATAILPGSHRQVFRHWRETQHPGSTIPPPLAYADPVPQVGSVGDVIFMHYLTVHSGSQNRSHQIRVGLNSAVMPNPERPYLLKTGAPKSHWTPLDRSLALPDPSATL